MSQSINKGAERSNNALVFPRKTDKSISFILERIMAQKSLCFFKLLVSCSFSAFSPSGRGYASSGVTSFFLLKSRIDFTHVKKVIDKNPGFLVGSAGKYV